MRPDLEQYYLIDQYLENKLKGEELTAFENQLFNNPSLAADVEEQRILNNLILEAELKSVRNQIEKDLVRIQNPSFFRTHWKWIGVGLLSVLSIMYYAISSKDHSKPSLQKSSVHSIENKNQSIPKEIKKTTQTENIQEKYQPSNRASKSEVPVSKDIDATSDNIPAIKNAEALTPTEITPTITKPTPVVEVKPSEASKTIDCSLTKISFAVTTETSCSNTQTGSIHIEKISGGITPYSVTVNNKKIKEKNISEVAAGTYEVKISDKNGCSAEHTVTVLEKICTPALQQGTKFNINPTIGETCNIPFDADKKGNVTIYNRSGKIIFHAVNPSADHVEWSGTDGYGALAEAGLYVYLIEYTDGTKVSGEVNIVR